MGIIIIAVVAVIALIGAVFVYNQEEASHLRALSERISALEAEHRLNVKGKVTQADLAEVEDQIFGVQSRLEKIEQSISAVETAAAKASVVELQQKKPFYVQLVPKNLEPAKKKPAVKK